MQAWQAGRKRDEQYQAAHISDCGVAVKMDRGYAAVL